MNAEVLKVINLYSKETKFADNLKELINILTAKVNSINNDDNNDVVLHNFYESDKFTEIKNEVIEPILKMMVKHDTIINNISIPWSNGEDEYSDSGVIEYKITYNLNNHKIIFEVQSLIDETTIIHAGIFIDDWLHFILVNHDGEVGYYQQDGDRGIQTYDETKAELFYKEFNTENKYSDMKEFYTHLLRASFLCIQNYLGDYLDELEDYGVKFV